MDVYKKKRHQRITIKSFTLNAITFAILSLNAKVGRADPCPSEITGAGLAGVACDFSANSSVTVENGGTVGGILMNSYHPDGSQIVIDAGGTVNNVSGTAINIVNSSLTNGLVNNGTISAGGLGVAVTDNSTVSGGIANHGTISATSGTGLIINNSSTINGGISNSGTITAGGNFEGISILGNSIVNGNVTNTGVINGANGIIIRNSTVNGDIVNSGEIAGHDAGILLQNVSHIDGGISNSGSIITSGSSSAGIILRSSSEISGAISNSGLISGGKYGLAINTSTVGSGISNSGTIRGGETGIAISSGSTVTGGISNSGTIQGGINAIYIDPSVSTDINILGQQARVIGNVNAENSNFNVTSGANFTSEGTFNVNNFDIASNAVFNMDNTITAHTGVNNAGTLSVASAQSIAGNYTQNTGGTFQTNITDDSHYGQLAVTGTADLQSGNINVGLTSASTFHAGEVFSNVISAGTLIGPTNGFNVTDSSFIWKFIANATGTGVDLTAAIDPSAYGACQGIYCQGAANAIIGQAAAGNAAFDPYNTLSTEDAFRTAASQATPELTNENNQALEFVTRSIMAVVPLGAQEDPISYQSGDIWFKPYGGTMMQNENNSVPGFNGTEYGVVMGKDIQHTNDGLFGAALAAGKDSLHGNGELGGQSIQSDTYEAMLYGMRKFPKNLYVLGQGLVGYGNNDTSREVPLYSSTATGSYNSWFTDMRGELGWNFYTLNQNLVLTPELDASYLYIHQGSYKESGSTMDLSVDSNHNSSLMLGAYGNAAYHLTTFRNQQALTLTGYAGIARNVLNNQPETTANFTAGGPSFSTPGTRNDQFVFREGTGVTYGSPVRPLSLSLNYDAQQGNNAHTNVGSLTVAYKMG